MAARYTARHLRQARHGSWVNRKWSRIHRPPARVLPAIAAVVVAGLLVGGASTAIALSPAGTPAAGPAPDSADIPPPDLHAGQEALPRTAARAPLIQDAVAGAKGPAAVVETGSCEATYYGGSGLTASGEAFDPTGHTAAHQTLPFGALVRVTNSATGASVVVRVNDRGPHDGDRCLVLSAGAFALIADPAAGVADVRYEALA